MALYETAFVSGVVDLRARPILGTYCGIDATGEPVEPGEHELAMLVGHWRGMHSKGYAVIMCWTLGIPAVFVLDADGVIRGKGLRGRALRDEVEKLVTEHEGNTRKGTEVR
jgi:hypothetical protein